MSHNRECVDIEVKAGVIHGRAVENCIRNHGEPIVYKAVSFVLLYVTITAIVVMLASATFYLLSRRKYIRSMRHAE